MEHHRLTNVDHESRTAICSVCGPTDIYLRGPSQQICAQKQRSYLRQYAKQKREEWRQTHPARPRGRKAKPKTPKPPRKPRVYGTQAHILSEINDFQKTAVCAVCGPVKIYVFQHENYTTRRCAKANLQNVAQAKHRRLEANRVFLDQYKMEHGCARCGYNENPLGLDLHHRNPSEKDLKISKVSSYCRERLLQELEKCDVLCAICHRLTHDELGWTY